MIRGVYILSILFIGLTHNLHAQSRDKGISGKNQRPSIETSQRDTLPKTSRFGLSPKPSLSQDSLGIDSLSAKSGNSDIKMTEDPIPSPIKYGAVDTMWFDNDKNEIHLFGDAFVQFEKYTIKAGYIIFDFENDITYAEGIKDAKGKMTQKPEFSDGNQVINYNKLKYNFKTKKGLVYDAVTQEGELYVLGATTKFIGAEADSLTNDDHIYQRNALVTSCNHPHPHFGIRASRLKVIPKKIAVAGPSNLEIAGVKTPLVLPFGFFPINTETASSGLIFPNDYEYSTRLGFGLREVGYYFPISDFIDLRVTGDIYTRGTYGIRLSSNYKKRYAFDGNIRLGFSDNRVESEETGNIESKKAYSISLSHNQNSKAHPYRKLGGTINISTSDYRSDNFNDATSVLQSVYRSNFNYSHSLPGSSFSLRVGMSHDQNTNTGVVNMTLPDLKVNMNTIYPFKRKNNTSGEEKWFEKINLKYDGAAKAFVRTQDSLLFSADVLDEIQYGISHRGSASASFRTLKYFNIVPSVNYDEIWFFRTQNQFIDENEFEINDSEILDITLEGDTIRDTVLVYPVMEEFVDGFRPYRNVNASVGISTQLFRTFNFKKGFIRGLRHVMKPTVSMGFNPGTREKYEEILYTDPFSTQDSIAYNPFAGGVFGTPFLSDESMSLNYSIINIFEGKIFSKKDSTTKKIRFFDNITVTGNYNFAADSLKWSPVRIRGTTKLFKGLSNFQFNATFDPYARNESGQYIDETIWSQKKRPLQFNNFMGSLNTRLKFSQIRDLFKGKDVDEADAVPVDQSSTQIGARFDENPGGATGFDPNVAQNGISGFDSEKEDSPDEPEARKKENLPNILDLLDNFSINHTYNFVLRKESTGVDTFLVNNNSLSLSGGFDLTDNWRINFDRISYDFKNRSLVYPSLVLTRDLHCWSMNFRWAPQRGVYSFFIGVKANTFDFMKYNYGQNRVDGRFQ